jgi:prepilin-type N-terminal cleavage/methylation domain-containing protein
MRGFTLIETIITVALTALLMGALAATLFAFNTLYAYQRAYQGATATARAVTSAFEAATMPATRVLASHTFASGTYSSGSTVLVLKLPSVDAGGTTLDGHYDYAAFWETGSSAYRLVEVDATSARRAGTTTLGTNLVSLSFSYNTVDPTLATTVTLDVVASSTVKGKSAASHAAESVRLRNF